MQQQIVGLNKIIHYMAFLKTAGLAIIFGSLYTIFRKYQSVAQLSEPDKQFNQPIFQSFAIFLGMSMIWIFMPFVKKSEENLNPEVNQLLPENKYIYIIPSLLDVVGTIIDTAGLFYTSVSVSQMLKGSVIFFTYIITLFYLKKSLSRQKHCYMCLILISLICIGLSNVGDETITVSKYQSNPILGNSLIILSQLLFSIMFIYEEGILNKYSVQVTNAVLWEGIWGAILSGFALMVFSHTDTLIKCDFIESCQLIYNNSNLLFAILITGMCIGPFNYFGISLTKDGSALQRCMICTFRMVVVWVLSIICGWEKFHLIQLIGYLVLTYGIYKFNQKEIGKKKELFATPNDEEASLQKQLQL